jgi:hypothetical protein
MLNKNIPNFYFELENRNRYDTVSGCIRIRIRIEKKAQIWIRTEIFCWIWIRARRQPVRIRSIVFHKKKRLLVYQLIHKQRQSSGTCPVVSAGSTGQPRPPSARGFVSEANTWIKGTIRYGSLRQSPQLFWGHFALTNTFFTLKSH